MPNPDYGLVLSDVADSLGFYLQQGAGIWSIAANVLPLDLPGPRRLLEIGCGFGFGLDIARRVRGWEVVGFDPSPLAGAGAAQLDLPIANRYFTPEEGEIAAYDAVICSEVLEHLFHPIDILRLLRSALRPGGVLVLTTPNAGAITPEMSPGILIPLLSVGYHTILHTAASLESLLRKAGFGSVSVENRGPQLLAQASESGTPWRDPNEADRADYRRYLEAAGLAAPDGSDLRIGLLGRAYREAVAGGRLDDADRLYPTLSRDIAARFGATPEDLAEGDAVSLSDLREEIPLNLGPILYSRAMHRRLLGDPPSALHPLLGRAATAAERLRTALAGAGCDDGDAEDLSWAARAEQMLAAAEAGVPVLPNSLGPAPGDPVLGQARLASLRRRVYVSLVNHGLLEAAEALGDIVAATEKRAERGEILDEEALDVLYCGTVSAANTPPGDPETAIRLARCLRGSILARLNARPASAAAGLVWPALAIEVMMLQRLDCAAALTTLFRDTMPAMRARADLPPMPAGLDLMAPSA